MLPLTLQPAAPLARSRHPECRVLALTRTRRILGGHGGRMCRAQIPSPSPSNALFAADSLRPVPERIGTMKRMLLVAACGWAMPSAASWSQCPDGTPPPCSPQRVAVTKPGLLPANIRARRMLLLPFRNVTRAPATDWLVTGAPLMLEQALGQFTDLTVVPEQRLTAAMRRLNFSLDASLDATQLQQLADATGGWTAISGNVIATGNKLRISAQALDIPSATVISRAETYADAAGDIRPAIDRLTVQLLAAVGVHGNSDLVALTTHSVDAYRAYANGMSLVQQGAFKRGLTALTEAVRLDSSFAMAWSAIAYADLQAGGLVEILNPVSAASRAAEQAVRHSDRLSPRQAAVLRVLLESFHANFARAHHLADSLVTADPEDVSGRMWLGLVEMLDSRLDTTKSPSTRAGSFNRSIEMMKSVLERDPSRLEVYAYPATIYAFASGFLDEFVGARRKPTGSLAAEFLIKQDVQFEPVLRDSIVFVPDTDYARLPADERAQARLRAANAGADWVGRWLIASPTDAEPHIWASRFEELRGDYQRALTELERAQSLRPESNLENLRARRLSLLELTGQFSAAESLADSIVQSGGPRTRPFYAQLDRSRAYVAAVYLRSRQWDKLASLVHVFSAPSASASCHAILDELRSRSFSVAPQELKAIADTVAAHIDEVRRVPELAPCAAALAKPP